jgi:dienelactone hydrolase
MIRTTLSAACLALLFSSACTTVTTAPAGPGSEAFAKLQPGILVGTPDGNGPFPVVILMHGCGGRTAEGPVNRENAYRDALAASGIAWLSFRSFPLAGRDFTSACGRPPGTIGTDERVDDLAEVLGHLGHYPKLDPRRVGMLGFSMGASTVIKAALRMDPVRAPGLKSGVALYPGCREFATSERIRGQRQLLVLSGTQDTWTPAGPCTALVTALREAGQAAEIHTYPDATHQWDNPGSTGGRQLSMGPGRGTTYVRYDAATARDSVARVVSHFRATL